MTLPLLKSPPADCSMQSTKAAYALGSSGADAVSGHSAMLVMPTVAAGTPGVTQPLTMALDKALCALAIAPAFGSLAWLTWHSLVSSATRVLQPVPFVRTQHPVAGHGPQSASTLHSLPPAEPVVFLQTPLIARHFCASFGPPMQRYCAAVLKPPV